MCVIKSFAVVAATCLPMAATAAPIPIFESLDGIILGSGPGGAAELDAFQYTSFADDQIEFFNGSTTDVFDADSAAPIFRASTVLRSRGETSSSFPDGPATEGTFLFQIGELSGASADLFGETAFLSITFDDPEAVSVLDDGTFVVADINVAQARIFATAPAPIPLPATLPLLLAALCGGVAIRSRRRVS